MKQTTANQWKSLIHNFITVLSNQKIFLLAFVDRSDARQIILYEQALQKPITNVFKALQPTLYEHRVHDVSLSILDKSRHRKWHWPIVDCVRRIRNKPKKTEIIFKKIQKCQRKIWSI